MCYDRYLTPCLAVCLIRLILPPPPPPQALSKESHFFSGALGRHCASSTAAYRSYFPTELRRWWVERVLRAGKVRGVCGLRAGGG